MDLTRTVAIGKQGCFSVGSGGKGVSVLVCEEGEELETTG